MYRADRKTVNNPRRGTSMVLVGISLTGLLFLTALAIDATSLMAARRQAQQGCDAAALGGCIQLASTLASGGTPTASAIQAAALQAAAQNQYLNGKNCTITVNWPPQSGDFQGDRNSVEVLLTFQRGNLVVGGGNTVTVRSVASCNIGSVGSLPMLILEPTAGYSFWIHSGALTLANAPIQVNSSSSKAAVVDGAANSAANAAVTAVGGSSGNFNPAPKGGGTPMPDPFALVPEPTTQGLKVYTQSEYYPDQNGNIVLNPGYYPNGLYVTHGGNVTLNPGLYYIAHGNFWINTPGTVTGNGVTIFHAGSDQSAQLYQWAGLDVGICLCPSNGNYTFNPPTSGPYAGISFFHSRSYTGEAFYDFWGRGNLYVGLQYFPKGTLRCWSANNGAQIYCNELVTGNFKLTGPHEIYGSQYNGGFSRLVWNAQRAAQRPPTSVYLAE